MDNNAVIESLAKRMQRDKKDIEVLLGAFVTSIQEYLYETDSVQLPGFGTFSSRKEDEKITTDLSTGRKILLPPAVTMQFAPSAILKRKIAD